MTRRVSRDKDGNITRVEFGTQSKKMAALLTGELTVADMDDEELARGYFKDKNGRFTGRPPAAVPRELHDRMMTELMRRGTSLYKEAYLDSIGTLVEIAKNKRVKESDRIRAATLIIERLAGKVPDKVLVGDIDPWQQIMDDILIVAGEEVEAKHGGT